MIRHSARQLCCTFQPALRLSGRLLAEAENIAVRIFDVEVPARPRPFFKRLRDQRAAGAQFVMQRGCIAESDVRIEMLVPLAMSPVGYAVFGAALR